VYKAVGILTTAYRLQGWSARNGYEVQTQMRCTGSRQQQQSEGDAPESHLRHIVVAGCNGVRQLADSQRSPGAGSQHSILNVLCKE
jgi:hypothetical protein